MTLSADVRVTRAGDFTLSAAVSAPAGTVTALLGPNGAGKSTLLRVLAGLLPLDAGRVVLDGTVYDDPTAGVLLPPERRPVGVVFQDYLLFPHLTALDNVAFGPRCRGLSRARSRQVAQEWLDRVGLGDLAGRRPRRLSGGQAQRVALARALATEPRLLLLDEPLAALDAGTRMRIRTELRRHLDDFGGVAVLVTHDPLDAMVLADQVVVLEEGRVVQCGAPREIATRPASRYVADLVGVNLVPGRGLGGDRVALDGCALTLPGAPVGNVLVAFPPAALRLRAVAPADEGRSWPVRVVGLESQVDRVLVSVEGPPDLRVSLPTGAVADLGVRVDARFWVEPRTEEAVVYPRPTTDGPTPPLG
ncbi:ABC transporter ATP-binding protein [Actinoalloteichus sp. AHMU CJ021]|uniref:ABC transporter ATP-binding protein n=1 Tax=Actinoalloteichus sp. AHMU CJ021 TaxID=2072503 RepID=UPI000CA0481A|nr:ABC transporter ATP-binding protein [Actinoalloteichus sp. AHMU CJ021]